MIHLDNQIVNVQYIYIFTSTDYFLLYLLSMYKYVNTTIDNGKLDSNLSVIDSSKGLHWLLFRDISILYSIDPQQSFPCTFQSYWKIKKKKFVNSQEVESRVHWYSCWPIYQGEAVSRVYVTSHLLQYARAKQTECFSLHTCPITCCIYCGLSFVVKNSQL